MKVNLHHRIDSNTAFGLRSWFDLAHAYKEFHPLKIFEGSELFFVLSAYFVDWKIKYSCEVELIMDYGWEMKRSHQSINANIGLLEVE